jgi:hypothetical protein
MLHLPFLHHQSSDDLVLGRLWRFPISPLVRVIASARTAHLYVIGMSGKGKSKLLEWCLYQDIAAGRGCGLIDPHSLLVDDLLRLLITQGVLANPDIRHRLIYVDPARIDYVIPFNVLATQAEHPYDIAAAVLEAFRRTWPECLREAPHFSNVVTAALIVLIDVFIDQKWPDVDAYAAPAYQHRVPGAVPSTCDRCQHRRVLQRSPSATAPTGRGGKRP